MRWSPKKREEYAAINDKGILTGLGIDPIFRARPGLWNLVWLHSVQIDSLLQTKPGSPDSEILSWTNIVTLCNQSASYSIGGISLETLADVLTVESFVSRIAKSIAAIPLISFFDEPENDSWYQFVTDRLENYYLRP